MPARFPRGTSVLTLLGCLLLGPVMTYNLLLTLGLGLSAWTAYLAIGRVVSSRLAALLGGLVYGFSPYMRAHSLGHVNPTLIFRCFTTATSVQ